MNEDAAHDTAWEIPPREVARMQSAGEAFLFLDCRKPEEQETARIEGTRLVPMHDLNEHLHWLREHEDDLIVVHCHKGRRSMIVTQVLREHGFTRVMSMCGGIQRWSEEVDPNVPTY